MLLEIMEKFEGKTIFLNRQDTSRFACGELHYAVTVSNLD
jgi:hypothetical protein